MSKARRVRRNAAEWQRIITQQQSSGQGPRAFCEQHGIGVASFYAWRRRLGAGGESTGEAGSDCGFVELRCVGDNTPGCIVIRCGGFAVEVTPGFDRAALRSVLQVAGSLTTSGV